MNYKLFFVCLCTAFAMIIWMVLQPGSLTFVGIRLTIALVAMVALYFSVVWNSKKSWKYAVGILLLVPGLGIPMKMAFDWGIVTYPIGTIVTTGVLIIGLLLYMKFVEPKLLRKAH